MCASDRFQAGGGGPGAPLSRLPPYSTDGNRRERGALVPQADWVLKFHFHFFCTTVLYLLLQLTALAIGRPRENTRVFPVAAGQCVNTKRRDSHGDSDLGRLSL